MKRIPHGLKLLATIVRPAGRRIVSAVDRIRTLVATTVRVRRPWAARSCDSRSDRMGPKNRIAAAAYWNMRPVGLRNARVLGRGVCVASQKLCRNSGRWKMPRVGGAVLCALRGGGFKRGGRGMGRTITLEQFDLSRFDEIEIASPCPALWEDMEGDDRARFCGLCRLNVYNISEMSREEAAALIVEKQGNVCVQIHRRADGTILTRDCPVGLLRLRQAALRGFGAVAATVVMVLGALVSLGASGSIRVREAEPYASVIRACRSIGVGPVRGFTSYRGRVAGRIAVYPRGTAGGAATCATPGAPSVDSGEGSSEVQEKQAGFSATVEPK